MTTRYGLEPNPHLEHQVHMERLRARIARRPGRWRRRMRPRRARGEGQSRDELAEPQAA
jgi:hypothetical protein